MTGSDPLSLTQAKRLVGNADTILLRATRPADLETPIGAFLRLDDGTTPAYLLESVEGGERLGRYSFFGVGPRALLEVRGGMATVQSRPTSVERYEPDLPVAYTGDDRNQVTVTRRMVQLSVTVEIVDQRSGRTLWQRPSLTVDGDYDPGNEPEGRRRALEKLTTDIVDGAQSQW